MMRMDFDRKYRKWQNTEHNERPGDSFLPGVYYRFIFLMNGNRKQYLLCAAVEYLREFGIFIQNQRLVFTDH